MEAFMRKATIKYLLLAAALLTLSVAPVYAQYDYYNKALQLDGNGDYAERSAWSALATTELTVEAWIKTSVTTGDQAIISRYKNNSGSNLDDAYQLSVHEGRARFQLNPGDTFLILDGTRWIADGYWHHVAGVYGWGRMSLVIDGEADGFISASGIINNPVDTNLRIGAAYLWTNMEAGYFFKGQIDEVRLWDKALGQRILQNMRLPLRGKSLANGSLRAAWRFNGPNDRGRAILVGNATEIPAPDVPLNENSYLVLDGKGEYVRIFDSNTLLPNYIHALTVEAWVSSRSTRWALQSVVSKFDSYFLGIEPYGVARFQVGGGLLYGRTNLLDGNFHHLAGVFDGYQIRLYVDGRLEANRLTYGAIAANTTSLYIGASQEGPDGADSDFFEGSIDDVRIWNVARTQSEIQSYMNSCWFSTPRGLVARWNFEADFINLVNLYTTPQFDGTPWGNQLGLRFDGSRVTGALACN
jgi:hypothetical protein